MVDGGSKIATTYFLSLKYDCHSFNSIYTVLFFVFFGRNGILPPPPISLTLRLLKLNDNDSSRIKSTSEDFSFEIRNKK